MSGTSPVRPESALRRWIARHDTTVFVGLTFGIAWPLWLASGALGRPEIRRPDLPWLIAQLGVFAPAVAAAVVAACRGEPNGRNGPRALIFVLAPATAAGLFLATSGQRSFQALSPAATVAVLALAAWILLWFAGRRGRLASWPGPAAGRAAVASWCAGCLLAPVGLFLLAWALVGPAPPGATAAATTSAGTAGAAIAGPTAASLALSLAVNLAYGGALGEEPGWRGLWLPLLLRRHSPAGASLILSVTWALWHAPIDLGQGFGLGGAGALLVRQVWTLPVTLLFTWVALRTGGSLLPPLILHAALNAMADFAPAQPARYERAVGLLFVFLLVISVAVMLADRRLRATSEADRGESSRLDLRGGTGPAG